MAAVPKTFADGGAADRIAGGAGKGRLRGRHQDDTFEEEGFWGMVYGVTV